MIADYRLLGVDFGNDPNEILVPIAIMGFYQHVDALTCPRVRVYRDMDLLHGVVRINGDKRDIQCETEVIPFFPMDQW